MLRCIFYFIFLASAISLEAQPGTNPETVKELESIKSTAGRNQWEKAKKDIEHFLSKPANVKNPDAWQLRSLILYKMVSGGDSLRKLAPHGHQESFDAYVKYLELLPKDQVSATKDHEILFGVSFANIERANNEFQHKRYAEALKAFLEVEKMEDYIKSKGLTYQGFSFPAFDTQLYINIAASAISAKQESLAVNYYRKIADNKIDGKGFDGIYRYLVDLFDRRGDRVLRDRYLATGRELYPSDPYWCQVLLREAGSEPKAIFAKYEELIKGVCNNYITHYNYAAELYNYAFRKPQRPAESAKLHPRIAELVNTALEFKQTPEANLLMCRYQLILINDLIDSYNAITTEDKGGKKQAINNQISQRYEEVAKYASAVAAIVEGMESPEKTEKQYAITAYKMLGDYWERKKDRQKQQEYEAKARSME